MSRADYECCDTCGRKAIYSADTTVPEGTIVFCPDCAPKVQAMLAALSGLPPTPDGPRTWTLPAAPGPEVTAVRTECPTCPGPVGGSLWHRLADDTWRCRDEGVHHDWVHGWVGLMVEHGDATDATGEVHSGQ